MALGFKNDNNMVFQLSVQDHLALHATLFILDTMYGYRLAYP